MAKAYSADMRQRVIDRVERGASRREAAEHYEVSLSTAVNLGEMLSRDRPLCRQAAWWGHLAVGESRGLCRRPIATDRRGAGRPSFESPDITAPH
jgi:hypothetical protein